MAGAAHKKSNFTQIRTGCAAPPTTADWRAGAEGIWKLGAALRPANQPMWLNKETQ